MYFVVIEKKDKEKIMSAWLTIAIHMLFNILRIKGNQKVNRV